MAQTKKPQRDLAEDIKAFRAELDEFISERVAALKVSYPNQPVPTLRMDLMKHRTCQCAVVSELLG